MENARAHRIPLQISSAPDCSGESHLYAPASIYTVVWLWADRGSFAAYVSIASGCWSGCWPPHRSDDHQRRGVDDSGRELTVPPFGTTDVPVPDSAPGAFPWIELDVPNCVSTFGSPCRVRAWGTRAPARGHWCSSKAVFADRMGGARGLFVRPDPYVGGPTGPTIPFLIRSRRRERALWRVGRRRLGGTLDDRKATNSVARIYRAPRSRRTVSRSKPAPSSWRTIMATRFWLRFCLP